MPDSNSTRSVEALQERPYDLSDPAAIATEFAGEAVEDAKDTVERIRYQKYLLEHSPGLGGEISRFARDRPIEALVIAAGAAFVLGAVWKFR
jgi:hypothetical protein